MNQAPLTVLIVEDDPHVLLGCQQALALEDIACEGVGSAEQAMQRLIDGEADAYVGDQLKFSDCVLAISEPRRPCFKFDAIMGFKQATKMMAQSGYCGFYLSVIQPGTIAAGETYELVPGAREVSIQELFSAKMNRRHLD